MRSMSLVVLGLWACGGGGHAAPDAMVDGPPDADFGAPSTTYPAFAEQIPQITKSPSGAVIASPRVVPVYYSDDTESATLQDFLTKLAASSYWNTMVGEYGVGPLAIATPINLSIATPATLADSDFRTWLTGQLDGSHSEWGAVDAATLGSEIFTFHFPSTTVISYRGLTSCMQFAGYHDHIQLPSGANAIYAIVVECPGTSYAPTPLELATSAYSHELVEAVTDPLPPLGYSRVGLLGAEWIIDYGPEVGDMCEFIGTSWFTPADLGYRIQRSWSNESARGAHDPCVPIPPQETVYFSSVPQEPDTVNVPGFSFAARGTNLSVGESKTIDVHLISDGPTARPWTVSALSDAQLNNRPATLTFAFDRTTGQNGEIVHMTITAVSRPTRGYELYRVVSASGAERTAWWGLVGITP